MFSASDSGSPALSHGPLVPALERGGEERRGEEGGGEGRGGEGRHQSYYSCDAYMGQHTRCGNSRGYNLFGEMSQTLLFIFAKAT